MAPRRYLAAFLAASTAALALTAAPSAGSLVVAPPNVVVILVDDARLSDLSTMPAVRSLIGDAGATFNQAVAPFPLCCPARATLLTGQYAHNHGVLGNGEAPNPSGGFAGFRDTETLATWLDADYYTGWMGKYFNGYSGTYVPPGWDSWKVPSGDFENYRSTTLNINGRLVTSRKYQTDLIGGYATGFVTRRAPAGPFLLVASLLAPHTGPPLEPDDPEVVYNTPKFTSPNVANGYRDAFATLPLDADPSFNEADVSDKPTRPKPLASWEVAALKEVNQQRRESLLSAEDVVSDIVGALRSSGELDNTYIIFVSDNGYALGEHRFRGGKVYPYEMAVRVPLLIRGPGIPPGTVVSQPVGQHDLAPTVLAMTDHAGAQGASPIDGVNLLPMLTDPSAHAGRPIVLEAGPRTETDPTLRFQGIRTPQWKYVEHDTGAKELYDLVADPYELRNRAGDPAYATQQAELSALLERYRWCEGTDCR